MTRHLFNANSIPETKDELSGRRNLRKKLRINSNKDVYWANALEMSPAFWDALFPNLSVSIDKNLRCTALPQNYELRVHDNHYSDIRHVNVIASQIAGNLSKLTSELRLPGTLLRNLSVFSGFPSPTVRNVDKRFNISTLIIQHIQMHYPHNTLMTRWK